MAGKTEATGSEAASPMKKTGATGWSAILATWTAVIGGGLGGVQWLAKYDEEIKRSEDSHVVQTFSLVDSFNRAEMLRIRERIQTIADATEEPADSAEGSEEAAQAPAAAPAVGTTSPASAVAALAPPASAEPDTTQLSQPDLFVYVDFFEAVQVCVQRALCNADLVDRLLKPYAVFDLLEERIAEVREGEKDGNPKHVFGEGIEWINAVDLQACTKARESDAEAECTLEEAEPGS